MTVLGDALPAEGIGEVKFARQVLLDQNFDERGSLLAHDGRGPVGYALAMHRKVPLENADPDFDRGFVTLLGVRPGSRGEGVGTALLTAAEGYLYACGCKTVWISSYAPGYFTPGVDVELYADGLGFLARRGYQEVYRPIAMETPLWNLRIPDWVRDRETAHRAQALEYLDFCPRLIRPLLEFVQRDFRGDWVRVCRQTALRILDGDAPRRLQVAVDASQVTPVVVGFSHFEAERFGPIGVDPSSRGQGIGQILMYRTLAAQRDAGLRSAWFLWSDDSTAERIYNGAGFRIVRRFAFLKKEIG